MILKDFNISNRISKDSIRMDYCECCLNSDPEIDDGYTTCCNELRVDRETAILLAKAEDIRVFLSKKFSVSTYYEDMNRGKIKVSLINKKKILTINLNRYYNEIIDEVKIGIKGLRKEF